MKVVGKSITDRMRHLDGFLKKGRRYLFRLNDGVVVEAEYRYITVDEDGYIVVVRNAVSEEEWYNFENMDIDTERIVIVEEA